MMTTNTVSAAGAAMPQDPIFAAVERYKPLMALWKTTEHLPLTDEEADAIYRPLNMVVSEIYQTVPATAAGLLALMEVMEEWDGHHLCLARPEEANDDGERGLIAVFRHAKRFLAEARA